MLRYDAFGLRDPKMRAVAGTRLGLIPHPSAEASDHIILVEGPPDMMCARSAGLPAVAIPGTHAWHPAWAHLLTGRRVTIVMDCDAPGRRAAEEIAASLDETADGAEVVDLWPGRDDGYDLTDRILERRGIKAFSPHVARTVRELLAPHPSSRRHDRRTRSHRI
jgi:DNA primase